MVTHFENDSATAEWLLESAYLVHEASGVCIEYRNGRITVDGVATVTDGIHSAVDLLAEVA
jgi:hypothetical protein